MSLWLNSGVPAAEVARRAGYGVAVLLKIYAHCIDGQADAANQRITDALSAKDTEQNPAARKTATARRHPNAWGRVLVRSGRGTALGALPRARVPALQFAITVSVLKVRRRAGSPRRRGIAAQVGSGHTGNTVRLIKAGQYFGAQRQFDIAHGKWSRRR